MKIFENEIKKLVQTGFFHIMGSNVINKIIAFFSSIILVRILNKSDYGMFSYVQNIITMFLLFNGIGTVAGVLQFGSEYKNNENIKIGILSYSIKLGMGFNFIIVILILIYCLNFELKIEKANEYLMIMAFMPLIIYAFDFIKGCFRIELKNKEFSFVNTLNTFLVLIFSILGAYFYEINGIIWGRYISYLITIIISFILLKKSIDNKLISNKHKLGENLKKQFFKFSVVSAFNDAISQILYTIDVFLIGYIIVDLNIVASYKIATTIPFALNFIPISIMIYVYPYFAQNNSNLKWIKSNYIILVKVLGVINLLIAIILFVFAPLIIKIMFGEQYLDSVASFRILAFGYFIAATFRIPSGNILVMMRKVKFNLCLSIITGMLNIILDIILIKMYGSIGAAIATVLVFIFTAIASNTYLYHIFVKNNKL